MKNTTFSFTWSKKAREVIYTWQDSKPQIETCSTKHSGILTLWYLWNAGIIDRPTLLHYYDAIKQSALPKGTEVLPTEILHIESYLYGPFVLPRKILSSATYMVLPITPTPLAVIMFPDHSTTRRIVSKYDGYRLIDRLYKKRNVDENDVVTLINLINQCDFLDNPNAEL